MAWSSIHVSGDYLGIFCPKFRVYAVCYVTVVLNCLVLILESINGLLSFLMNLPSLRREKNLNRLANNTTAAHAREEITQQGCLRKTTAGASNNTTQCCLSTLLEPVYIRTSVTTTTPVMTAGLGTGSSWLHAAGPPLSQSHSHACPPPPLPATHRSYHSASETAISHRLSRNPRQPLAPALPLHPLLPSTQTVRQ